VYNITRLRQLSVSSSSSVCVCACVCIRYDCEHLNLRTYPTRKFVFLNRVDGLKKINKNSACVVTAEDVRRIQAPRMTSRETLLNGAQTHVSAVRTWMRFPPHRVVRVRSARAYYERIKRKVT